MDSLRNLSGFVKESVNISNVMLRHPEDQDLDFGMVHKRKRIVKCIPELSHAQMHCITRIPFFHNHECTVNLIPGFPQAQLHCKLDSGVFISASAL